MRKKPNFQLAASEAERLINKYGYSDAPIDPELIAEEEGIDVVYATLEAPFDKEVSGFFRLSDNTIVVNEEISDNRILFTIAHELGHAFLHADYIASKNYIPIPRRNIYASDKPIEEIEADTFAANLLVPLRMLKRYRKVASVDELARLFFVSRDVIVNRIDLLERHPNLAR